MKRKIPSMIGLCLLSIISLSCWTFAAGGTQYLTLEKAIQMALDYDPQVATARNNVTIAKLAVKQVVLKNYPQATVEDSQAHDFNRNANPNIVSLSVKETVPTNFNIYGTKAASDIEAAFWDQVSNEAAQRIAEANVRYNTASLYVAALEAKKNLDYQEKVRQYAEAALLLAQQQLKQGKITRPQELQAENDLTTAKLNVTQNSSNYLLALRQLGNQIGLADTSRLQLSELTPPAVNPDAAKLKETALPKRLELQQAEMSIRKAERTLVQAQNQKLVQTNLSYINSNPTTNTGYSLSYDFVSGNVSGNFQTQSDDSRIVNTSNTDTLLQWSRNNIQLTFTWNLDWGVTNNQIAQNQVSLENARKNLELVRQNAGWDIDQAIANYQLVIQKITTNQQLLPFYQKQLELKKLALKIGSATQTDVNSAEQALLQAQLQVDLAQYDLVTAYQKLRQVTGDLYN